MDNVATNAFPIDYKPERHILVRRSKRELSVNWLIVWATDEVDAMALASGVITQMLMFLTPSLL